MLREGLIRLSRSSAMETLVRRTPLRAMSRRFVPGETLDDLLRAMVQAEAEGLRTTANYLGEAQHNRKSCRQARDAYVQMVRRIAREGVGAGISVKFTQLGQDVGDDFLRQNLRPLLEEARDAGVFVRFDMESSEHTRKTLDAFEELWSEGWRDIGVVLQSYLRRTVDDVHRMNELGAPVRLCKGAYDEPARVAFQSKAEVDGNYVRCMKLLLAGGHRPAIATHDPRMIEETLRFVREKEVARDGFEFQMLHGVRRDLQRRLADQGWGVRIYIPFGKAWYPYLMRRLAERPANVVFLAGSVIQESPLGFLWPDGGTGK